MRPLPLPNSNADLFLGAHTMPVQHLLLAVKYVPSNDSQALDPLSYSPPPMEKIRLRFLYRLGDHQRPCLIPMDLYQILIHPCTQYDLRRHH